MFYEIQKTQTEYTAALEMVKLEAHDLRGAAVERGLWGGAPGEMPPPGGEVPPPEDGLRDGIGTRTAPIGSKNPLLLQRCTVAFDFFGKEI